MKLTVIRTDLLPDRTLGYLDIDGQFFAHSLEDPDRRLEDDIMRKVPNETAIPRGKYPVVLDFSARFKRTLPHVLSVPGFTGIRIHAGNSAADSSGCVLLGDVRTKDGVGSSRVAMDRLMALLTATKEPITLEVL